MSEGTLVEWLVQDGESVTEGQVLYRIETDKVENDVESPVAGVVHITGVEGETYEVALRDDRVALGWAEVSEALNRVANGLRALDLGPQERAAVLAENSSETV